MRHLVLTLGYPPLVGGIETMMEAVATRLPGEVRVVTRATAGDADYDATSPVPVFRASPLAKNWLTRAYCRVAGQWLHPMLVPTL